MGQMIELAAADGHRFAAYRAGPENARAGLLVIQEIFGVNRHMRQVADRFASAGYAVISPALFDRAAPGVELGYQPEDAQTGVALRAKIALEDTLKDITAAAKALNTAKTGIVGYCWGGSLAWIGATQTSLFDAASGWYGAMIVKTKNARPRCPVQLHFGENDQSIPLTDVAAIREAQPEVAVYTYPAGHGFGCEERASYNAAATTLAEERTLRFFAEHLWVGG